MTNLERFSLFLIGATSALTANQGFSLPEHNSVKIDSSISLEQQYWNMTGDQIKQAMETQQSRVQK